MQDRGKREAKREATNAFSLLLTRPPVRTPEAIPRNMKQPTKHSREALDKVKLFKKFTTKPTTALAATHTASHGLSHEVSCAAHINKGQQQQQHTEQQQR